MCLQLCNAPRVLAHIIRVVDSALFLTAVRATGDTGAESNWGTVHEMVQLATNIACDSLGEHDATGVSVASLTHLQVPHLLLSAAT